MSEEAETTHRIKFEPKLPDHVEMAVLHVSQAGQYPLHDAEAASLHSRTSPSRRLAFQVGRAAAHIALGRLGLGYDPILRGEHREPIWPEGVVGSITHASDYALALVGPRVATGGIGIDLELVRMVDGLAEQVAHGEEVDYVAGISEEDRPVALMTLFSAKETIFKAFFPRVGSYFGFEAARVDPPYQSERLEARLVEPLDPFWPTNRSFQIDFSQYGDFVLTALVLPADA